MKKTILVLLILLGSIGSVYSQVTTRYFEPGTRFEGKDLRLFDSNSMNLKTAPKKTYSIDASDALKRYVAEEKDDSRYGIPIDVNYSISDGDWGIVDNGRIWSLGIESGNALSLTFVLDDISLSKGAEIYIVNEDKTTIFGPVTNKSLNDTHSLLTSIIPGSKATILIYEPNGILEESSLTISRVIYGFKDVSVNDGIATSRSSNHGNNVACYPEWDLSANAVGIVNFSDGYMASGALLMATDYSFRPFFLSSFKLKNHIINFNLTPSFTFCSRRKNCSSSTMATTYTFSGAQLRATSMETGFALFELTQDVKAQPDIAWLGWDNNDNIPTSGGFIFNSSNSGLLFTTQSSSLTTAQKYNVLTDQWFLDDIDVSHTYTRPNSNYGSPLFDQNQRVVGQLNFYDQRSEQQGSSYIRTDQYYFGRFGLSWDGDDTNSTRLSNWLDPAGTGQNTMDSYYPIYISGPSSVKTSGVYTIENLPSGMTVTWSLSDSYYNQNCLQQSSPSSNQCTIVVDNSHNMIFGTLTATMRRNGNIIQTYQTTVSAGVGFLGTYYNGQATVPVNQPYPLFVLPGTQVVITSPELVGASVSYTGDITPTSWSFDGDDGELTVGMPSTGGTSIVVQVACSDGRTYNLPIVRSFNPSMVSFEMVNGDILISVQTDALQDEAMSLRSGTHDNEMTCQVEVVNSMTMRKVYEQSFKGSSLTISTSGWPSGVYIVSVTCGGEKLSEKVIVK